jgi:hypothetical protein
MSGQENLAIGARSFTRNVVQESRRWTEAGDRPVRGGRLQGVV